MTMEERKGFVNIIGFVAAVLLVVGGVGYLLGTRDTGDEAAVAPPPEETDGRVSVVEDVRSASQATTPVAPPPQTQGIWKEYRSPYGFSFRYPDKTYTISATTESFPGIASQYSSVGGQVLSRPSGYKVGEECYFGESGLRAQCPTEIPEIGFFPVAQEVKSTEAGGVTPFGGQDAGIAKIGITTVSYRDVSAENVGRFEYFVPMKNGGTLIITKPFKSESERRDLYRMLFNQPEFQRSANPWAKLFYQIFNTIIL